MINLENEMLTLTLSLYSNPVIPRNIVQYFIDQVIHFTNVTYATYLQEQMKLKCRNVDKNVFECIQEILHSSKVIFKKFETEYQRFSLYKEKDLLIMPIDSYIGTRIPKKLLDSEVPLSTENFDAQYIPLKSSLKILLEISGMFETMMNYTKELQAENSIISNFMQSQVWKDMSRSFGDKCVRPLFVYSDEFEPGNALGSHGGKNKIGALYTILPCFPPNIVAHLDNILLTSLFYASDYKQFGNPRIFQKLTIQLNDLRRDGIILQIGNKTYKIYFQLCLVLDDNLGLNQMLGFVDNFNSGRPCRICRADINQIHILTKEDEQLLRTIESYEKDCIEKTANETGVKEKCFFNQVEGFYVCKNITLDLMHDVFEGTAQCTMANICYDLIYEQKLFSLEFLNNRID